MELEMRVIFVFYAEYYEKRPYLKYITEVRPPAFPVDPFARVFVLSPIFNSAHYPHLPPQ